MTEKKNYPEEIYPETATQAIDGPVYWISHRKDYEKAYDIGLAHGKEQAAQSDPLAGFSNLTQAIQDGVRIDYSRLDSKLAKIFHGEHGVLLTRFELQEDSSGLLIHPNLEEPDAWREEGEPLAYLLDESWLGNFGWSLWVEGEIPVKPRTANELKPGSVFMGKNGLFPEPQLFSVAYNTRFDEPELVAYRLDGSLMDCFYAERVAVVEVKSGGFQPPKEEA